MGDEKSGRDDQEPPAKDSERESHDEVLRSAASSSGLADGLTDEDRRAIAREDLEPGFDDHYRWLEAQNKAERKERDAADNARYWALQVEAEEKRAADKARRAELNDAIDADVRPTITLPDGEKVLQNPDGTFEYLDGAPYDPTLPEPVSAVLPLPIEVSPPSEDSSDTGLQLTETPEERDERMRDSAAQDAAGSDEHANRTMGQIELDMSTEPSVQVPRDDKFWSAWRPWITKGVLPVVAAGAVVGGTLTLINGGEPAATSPVATVETQDGTVEDDCTGSDCDPQSSLDSDSLGVTELELVPCRSDTEGCDAKGDPEIVGTPIRQEAEGADITFATSGYDPNADGGSGEHQIQLGFSGNAASVSTSPNTASYVITLTGSTDAGEFELRLRWEQGGQVDADLVTVDGSFVDNPVVIADWTSDTGLWVAIKGTGASMPADTVSVDVTAEILNADGTPGAVITDQAGA